MTPRQPPAEPGPFGKLLAVVAGAILLVAGLMFSVLILAALAVLGLLAWGYFWWKTRSLRKAMAETPVDGVVIEGEAIVVEDAEPPRNANETDSGDKYR